MLERPGMVMRMAILNVLFAYGCSLTYGRNDIKVDFSWEVQQWRWTFLRRHGIVLKGLLLWKNVFAIEEALCEEMEQGGGEWGTGLTWS